MYKISNNTRVELFVGPFRMPPAWSVTVEYFSQIGLTAAEVAHQQIQGLITVEEINTGEPGGGDALIQAMFVLSMADGYSINLGSGASCYALVQAITDEFGTIDSVIYVMDEDNTTFDPPGVVELGSLVAEDPLSSRLINSVTEGTTIMSTTVTYQGHTITQRRHLVVSQL